MQCLLIAEVPRNLSQIDDTYFVSHLVERGKHAEKQIEAIKCAMRRGDEVVAELDRVIGHSIDLGEEWEEIEAAMQSMAMRAEAAELFVGGTKLNLASDAYGDPVYYLPADRVASMLRQILTLSHHTSSDPKLAKLGADLSSFWQTCVTESRLVVRFWH
jgi:hypothetical protein